LKGIKAAKNPRQGLERKDQPVQRNLLSAVSAAALSLALLGAAPAYPQDDTTALPVDMHAGAAS